MQEVLSAYLYSTDFNYLNYSAKIKHVWRPSFQVTTVLPENSENKSFLDFSYDFTSIYCFRIGPPIKKLRTFRFWQLLAKFEDLLKNLITNKRCRKFHRHSFETRLQYLIETRLQYLIFTIFD